MFDMKSSKSKYEPIIVRLSDTISEQKDLLDKLAEEYDRFIGEQGAIYTATSPYSVLYWAVKYSGLIEEKKSMEDTNFNIGNDGEL